jgi:hypothetical protein
MHVASEVRPSSSAAGSRDRAPQDAAADEDPPRPDPEVVPDESAQQPRPNVADNAEAQNPETEKKTAKIFGRMDLALDVRFAFESSNVDTELQRILTPILRGRFAGLKERMILDPSQRISIQSTTVRQHLFARAPDMTCLVTTFPLHAFW